MNNKKFYIQELRLNDELAGHYINDCQSCVQTSPFAVTLDDKITIVFMGEVKKVEECD